MNFLLTKSDAWSHEHEWRILCNTKEDYLPFDCISGIYLGVDFKLQSEEMTRLADAASTYTYLPIYQCKLNLDRYQIDIETSHYAQFCTYLLKRNQN